MTPTLIGIRDNLNIVIRQLLTLSAGEGAARGLHALAFLLLARQVGPGAVGEFGVAQAVASYGLMAVHRGLDVPAILRVGRDPRRAGAVLAAVLRLRLPVFAALLAGAIVWGNWLILAMVGMWLAAALQARWLLLARRESRPVAVAAVLAAVIFLSAVIAGLPLAGVAGALSMGELVGAAWCWLAAGVSLEKDNGLAGEMQREAWPFLASLLLGNLLYNMDVFVLGGMRSAAEVGLYVAAYRLLTVFSPVLGALQSSSLPLFGELYPDRDAAGKLVVGVWARSVSVAAVIAVAVALTAGSLLSLLYGSAFSKAAPLVMLLMVVLPIQVTRMVFRQAVLAFKGERRDLANLTAAVGVNLVLDLLLAPQYGAMGCAVSTVFAEVCFAILTWQAWQEMRCA